MELTRRNFMKATAAAAAFAAAGAVVLTGNVAEAEAANDGSEVGQGPLPFLRHRLRRARRGKGRENSRHQG